MATRSGPDLPSAQPSRPPRKKPRLSNDAINDIAGVVLVATMIGVPSYLTLSDKSHGESTAAISATSNNVTARPKYHPGPVEKDDCFYKSSVVSSYSPPEQTKHVPLTIHRVLPSDGHLRNMYNAFVSQGIDGLNRHYRDLNIDFYVTSLHDVSDDALFNFQNKGIDALRAQLDNLSRVTAVPDTLNIYMLPEFDLGGVEGLALGRSLELSGDLSRNQIYISYDTSEAPDTVFAHEVGHIFSLAHTHHSPQPSERYCDINGDKICDTPPDPGPAWFAQKDGCVVNDQCEIESCGNPEYLKNKPLVTNIMGYYPAHCATGFTEGQKAAMTCVLQRNKPELLRDTKQGAVSLDAVETVNCRPGDHEKIQTAVDKITRDGGGRVEICAGVYHERLLLRGMESPSYFKDKYALNIDIDAARDASGNYQNVTIDGQNKNSFITVIDGSVVFASDDPNKLLETGGVNLGIQGIDFINGRSSEWYSGKNLFHFSALSSYHIADIEVRDSVVDNNVLGPAFFGSTITDSSFKDLKLKAGASVVGMSDGSLTLANMAFSNVQAMFNPSPNFSQNRRLIEVSKEEGDVRDLRIINATCDGLCPPFMEVVTYQPESSMYDHPQVEVKLLPGFSSNIHCSGLDFECEKF